jgi:putative ATP-dependent endonuclease of OLD family
LYLALLRALAEEIRASSEVGREKSELSRPFILLFEEPEAFLHPALQREMGEALQSISVGNQVVVSTHSPILVTPERVESVIILRQEPSLEGSCITRCSIPHLDLLPNEEDKQLAAMLKFTNSSEFLFADHVLVVEGPSDRALLEACWSKSRKSLRDTSGPTTLAIIEACSKNVVPIWLEYLKAMGLIACGVLDLDFLWDGAGRCLGPDDDLSRFSESFWKLAEEDGIACKRDNGYFIPSEKKREAFALVCQRLGELTEKLRSRLRDLGIWVLSKGEIECYFNLSPSSKSQYAKASQKVRKGEIEIDPEIHDILRWVLQYPPRAGGVGADGIRTSTIGGPQ